MSFAWSHCRFAVVSVALVALAAAAPACKGSSSHSSSPPASAAAAADETGSAPSSSWLLKRIPAPEDDIPRADGDTRRAVFAGGCFWCVEAIFEELDGVEAVVSGYAGGSEDSASYEQVLRGDTGHAEAVEVRYDPAQVSYGTLLRVFFATHDPTQLNRQGPDVGEQYRSAVFFASADEERVARAYIAQLGRAAAFDKPIVTTLEPLTGFYEAEEHHQDYARRNPGAGYIRVNSAPKVEKLRKQFPELLGEQEGEGASAGEAE